MVTPAAKREAVAHLRSAFDMSERRACRTIGCVRMTVRYRCRRPDDAELRHGCGVWRMSAGASATGACTSCCDGRASW